MLYRVALTVLILTACSSPTDGQAETPRQFRVWATSCAHVPADIKRGRESLAKVIRQSEGLEKDAPAFEWDINIDAGDVSAHQTPPGDPDGRELIRQYRAMTKHRREQVYNVPGNHDAPYYDHGPGSWFRKWGDPLGENTVFSGVDPKRRPFPVEGTWERYSFQAGNILFLMLSDRNDAPTPVGRGHSSEGNSGGYPPGAVTRDTFNWWKQQVLDNQDKIIITMHHHALRDTTTASGYGEGNPTYHGSTGGPEGSSYLYFIIEKDDPEDFHYTKDAHVFEDFLDTFHKENGRGAIDFWIAGHTHVKSPDDDFGGKSISETRWGVNFLQVAGLTRYHGGSTPLSRLLTFTDGSDQVKADVYLHEAWYEDNPIGWYAPASKTFSLRQKFAAPEPIERLPPFPEVTEDYDEPYVRPKVDQPLEKAGPSPDLTTSWDKENGGPLHLEALLEEDTDDRIDSKPVLVLARPAAATKGSMGPRPVAANTGRGPMLRKTGHAARFDGTQRVRVGPVDMEDWTDLTVSAWINTTKRIRPMRVASKDRIGKPGLFMLLYRSGAWIMQAWDDQAGAWCTASWRSISINDGGWHSLVGVVDSRQAKVLLYVDGELKAEAPWTAETLDDSDKTDLAIGADSGEEQFGHTFQGMIHDVHLYPRALSLEQIKALGERRKSVCP